jgi:hypothetical protein
LTQSLPSGILFGMEALYKYFYSLSVAERKQFSADCNTTAGYMQKVLYAWKTTGKVPRFDGELCRLIHENSRGLVKKQELRPDIWPELVAA